MAQVVSDPQRIMGQVSATAMLDDAFRARLEEAPQEVLREFGMAVPDSVRLEIVTDPHLVRASTAEDPTVRLYVPDVLDLSEEELAMVAGAVASCQSTYSTICTIFTVSSTSTASTWSSG